MGETRSKKQPLPYWRRIALVLIVIAIVGLGAQMLAGYLIEMRLDSKIAAIHKAGYPVSFEQLAPRADSATTDDAAALYTSALSSLSTTDMEGLAKILSIYRNAMAAEALSKLPPEFQSGIASILAQHQFCLDTLDNAATLPMAHYDIGLQYSLPNCIQSLGQIQKALTVLSLRTTFLIVSKEYDGSAKSIITMLKATRVFDTYPIITVSNMKQHFIRLACDNIRILILQGKPSDSMIGELANALTEAFESNTIKGVLLAEQVFQIETTRNLLSEKTAEDLLQKNIPEIPERPKLPQKPLPKIRLRLLVLQYFNEMGDLIETSSKSPSELLEFLSDQKKKISVKIQSYFASTHSFVEASIATSVAVKSTSLVLHIEKYRRSNGYVPNSLEDIAGDIDPLVMTDPYTGAPMLYKKSETSYIIYSPGPDGIDNGGSINAQISQVTGQIEKMPEDIGLRMLIPKE
jgi:hypothetical protein